MGSEMCIRDSNLSRGVDTRKRLFAIVPENAKLEKDDLKRAAGLR